MMSGRQAGTVRWFNPGKGFGFIAIDGGNEDAFVHASDLSDGRVQLCEGTRVSFLIGAGRDGRPRARRVQPA
jgi:cold shock protein